MTEPVFRLNDGALRVFAATLSGYVQLWNLTRGEGMAARVVSCVAQRSAPFCSPCDCCLDQEAFRKSARPGSNHTSSGAVLSGSDKAVEHHKLHSCLYGCTCGWRSLTTPYLAVCLSATRLFDSYYQALRGYQRQSNVRRKGRQSVI
jgi:hypothetical protein